MRVVPINIYPTSYRGAKECWYEQTGDTYRTTEAITLLHISYVDRVKSFDAGVETCFYSKDSTDRLLNAPKTKQPKKSETMGGFNKEWMYLVTIPAGTIVTEVGSNEIRATINTRFSIQEIGQRISWKTLK